MNNDYTEQLLKPDWIREKNRDRISLIIFKQKKKQNLVLLL